MKKIIYFIHENTILFLLIIFLFSIFLLLLPVFSSSTEATITNFNRKYEKVKFVPKVHHHDYIRNGVQMSGQEFYKISINYEYNINNKKYKDSKIFVLNKSKGISKYYKGNTVIVYYLPIIPSISFINNEFEVGIIPFILLFLVLLYFVIGFTRKTNSH